MISGLSWPLVAGLSAIISFVTFISGLVEDDPAEKKAGILCGLISIAITLLFAVLMISVFGTWFGSGALSGGC